MNNSNSSYGKSFSKLLLGRNMKFDIDLISFEIKDKIKSISYCPKTIKVQNSTLKKNFAVYDLKF